MAQIYLSPKSETESDTSSFSDSSPVVSNGSAVGLLLMKSSLKLSHLALWIGAGLSIVDLIFDLVMVRVSPVSPLSP